MADYKKLIPFIKKSEGGFVNDPLDRGGATNMGITINTYRTVYGSKKTVDDLKHITEQEWEHVFKHIFWDRCKADEIKSQGVANNMVDWVWGSGVSGIKGVQRLVGVKADGIVGSNTLAAINAAGESLFPRITQARIRFYNAIVSSRPNQKRFLNGWICRAYGVPKK